MNTMQAVHNILVLFSFLHELCYHILCLYLRNHFLRAPCKYVHPGLVLGLDCTSCQLSSTCIFFVCPGPPSILLFVPTIHASHVHPPLTTRQLNTKTQINNGHATSYIQQLIICTSHNYHYSTLSSYFFYILGQAGWPRPLMSGTVLCIITCLLCAGNLVTIY
jgi:hypothetical protein